MELFIRARGYSATHEFNRIDNETRIISIHDGARRVAILRKSRQGEYPNQSAQAPIRWGDAQGRSEIEPQREVGSRFGTRRRHVVSGRVRFVRLS